ncbi:MAG TPA: hypothetical protein VGN97_15905 [Mesorhizobium sp.]|jgi:hypothetical protein|nr:hypothetical protein [Mesorhizobium sp.]
MAGLARAQEAVGLGPHAGPDGGRLNAADEVAPAPTDGDGSALSGGTIRLPTDELFRASTGPSVSLKLPGLSGFAPQGEGKPLATAALGEVTLAAQLIEEGEAIGQGLIWRVFGPEPDGSGKLPLVASARGGTSVFQLAPGSYLVHASFGRAGATTRITVGREPRKETLVLDAGGLKLDAVIADGSQIDAEKLKFSIYEGGELDGERALIIPDVSPGTVVRLRSGIYHIVSTYGAVNAVIRSDIWVEAGKLTEATVEHHAAELTLKLVREAGGEAMADTSWSVLTDAGDIVRESVGPYFEMVLAEGEYTVIAKNRDRIYRQDFTVTAGQNAEVEVIANEASAKSDRDILD